MLTPKQQRFVDAVVGGASPAQAAIAAGYSEKTAPQAGSRLLKDVKIAPVLAEHRAKASAAAGLTLQSHLDRLNELASKAATAEQYSAAVTAETNRGKASGFYVERKEHTGANGGPIVVSVRVVREGRRRTAG